MIHRHLANGQQQMMNRPCEKKQQFSILVHREVFIRRQSNVMQTQVVRHSLRCNVLAVTLKYNVQPQHFYSQARIKIAHKNVEFFIRTRE